MNYSKSELRDDRDSTLKLRAIPAGTKLTWQECLPFFVLCILIAVIIVTIA